MKSYTFTLLSLLILLGTTQSNAQSGYSVADAIPVDFSSSGQMTSTILFNNVNSQNSTGSSLGTQGGCSTTCCSTLVYKVILPVEGALHVNSDNFTTQAGSMLTYTGPANASSNADLTFLTAAGNPCFFRDSLFLGRGYRKWNTVPGWADKATWNPANGEYSIPAGTYYIHFWNYNQQTSNGASSNLTFEFTPYCVEDQPEIEVKGNSMDISDGDNTPSVDDDTDFGMMLSGDPAISRTFTIENVSIHDLDIFSVNITGDNAADFSITAAPAALVSGNTSTTFTIEFTPATVGVINATVEISNTDCDRALFDFDIQAYVSSITPSDVRGNMLELSGAGEYVEINNVANSMDGETQFTLEAWINADATQTGTDRIVSINTAGGGNVFLFYLDNGVLSTFDGSDQDTYGTDLRGTGWHHVAVTHNNSRDSVYLDGVYMGTFAASVSAFAANNLWSIGQEYDSGPSPGDYFKGKMDEIRIWKDVRTKKEIQENMHRTFSLDEIRTMENLVAYYQFDSDDAATTADGVKDILGNHGTIINGGTYTASEVAVGAGVSVTRNVIAAEVYEFGATGIRINFVSLIPDGDVVVTRITSEAVKNGSAGEMANTLNEYWVVRNYGTVQSGGSAIVFFHFENGFIDDDVAANHAVHKRGSNEYGTADWADLTPLGANSADGDNRISLPASSFSQFYVSSNTSDFMPTVLPVELVHFNARRVDGTTVQLDWETASETNNSGFEIERKDGDDGKFESVAWIVGGGTTSLNTSYRHKDSNSYQGTSYYRLKQVDFDGSFDYSHIEAVKQASHQAGIEIFPNPVKGELHIIHGEGRASVYNMFGQTVRQFTISDSQFSLDTSRLPQGQYILHIQRADGQVVTKRFVK